MKTNLRIITCIFSLLCAAAIFAACSGQPTGNSGNGAGGGGAVHMVGSGASFPKPIYEKWVSEFGKVNPSAKIDYQSTGSSAGIKAIQQLTADFGASDAPMSDDDFRRGT